jgi:glycerol-3-phosphate dehydrogenase subunit B
MRPATRPYDVAVVGLGLAGLMAGLSAAEQGASVLALGKGYGTTHFRAGTIDVLGYVGEEVVAAPRSAVATLCDDHPYSQVGQGLEPALGLLSRAAAESGLVFEGGLDANVLVGTAAGTLRPSCLVPASLLADWAGARVLAVGLGEFRDFDPELFASVVPGAAAERGIDLTTEATRLDLPQLERRHLDGPTLARLFSQAVFREQLVDELRPRLGDASLVALPAVLGLEKAAEVHRALVDALGRPVVEVSTLPPSIAGMRLQRALEAALRRRGGSVQVGVRARLLREGPRAVAVETGSAAHPTRIPASSVVLASGGLASGGLAVQSDGAIVETVAGLPVAVPAGPSDRWFGDAFLGPSGQAANLAGLRVDDRMRPVDDAGETVADNLFAAGGLLAGASRAVERSADGIACATGYLAGREAAA